jgi:hypothetical protein
MPTSFSLCCASTSARISWNLPPEDLLDADYIPSLWAVRKMMLLVLLAVVLGPLSLVNFITAGPAVHRHLTNAPRKRKPQVRYPVRGLFQRLWRSPPNPRERMAETRGSPVPRQSHQEEHFAILIHEVLGEFHLTLEIRRIRRQTKAAVRASSVYACSPTPRRSFSGSRERSTHDATIRPSMGFDDPERE